jgi:RNA-binding motif X-linked protein 2
MYEYLVNKRKEEKALKKAKKAKSSSKRKDETPDERRARKEKKRAKKEKKHAGVKKKDDAPADRRGDQEKSLEELMREFQNEGRAGRTRIRSPSGTPPRESQQSLSRTLPGRRSRSPATDDRGGPMAGSKDRRSSRSRSPRRDHGRHRDDDSDMRYTERRRR